MSVHGSDSLDASPARTRPSSSRAFGSAFGSSGSTRGRRAVIAPFYPESRSPSIRRLAGGGAAVDGDGGAADVAGAVGREERHDVGDLLGLTRCGIARDQLGPAFRITE